MSSPTVLAICGDPGGASALAPVLHALMEQRRTELRVLAYNQALDVLAARGIVAEAIPPEAAASWPADSLRALRPAAIVAATSCNGRDYERHFIVAARAAGIPSLALLDFWSNYRQRFTGTAGELIVPDAIAVMDEAARVAMVECGFPPAVLRITGQPAFDSLAARREAFGAQRRSHIRRATGTADDDLQVLFVSQPLRALYGTDATAAGHPGYDETEVLLEVQGALAAATTRLSRPLTLVVRPHPRERLDSSVETLASPFRTVVSAAGDQYEAAMAADLVIGMSSVLVIEAWQLGCAVLSLQPGATQPVFGTQARDGLAVETDRTQLRSAVQSALARVLAAGTARGRDRFPAAATPKVVQCVYSLISDSSRS